MSTLPAWVVTYPDDALRANADTPITDRFEARTLARGRRRNTPSTEGGELLLRHFYALEQGGKLVATEYGLERARVGVEVHDGVIPIIQLTP